MNLTPGIYTYRSRERLALKKSPNEFVVRATSEKLTEYGITDAKKVSPSS
jgi:hypothetical protein